MPKNTVHALSDEKELNLIDFLTILYLRRWTIAATMIAFVLLAGAYIMFTTKEYVSRTVFETGAFPVISPNGELSKPRSFESRTLIVEQLKEDYKINDFSESPRTLPLLSHAEPTGEFGIQIIAKGATPEDAQQFLLDVVNKLTSEQIILYEQFLKNLDDRKKIAEDAIHRPTIRIEELDSQLSSSSGRNSTTAPFLLLEKLRLESTVYSNQRLLNIYSLAISDLFIMPPHVIRGPTLTLNSVYPRTYVLLAVAILFGLISGVLLGFGLEMINWARQNKKG